MVLHIFNTTKLQVHDFYLILETFGCIMRNQEENYVNQTKVVEI